MKNNKIFNSWDKVKASESSKEQVLENILNQTPNYERRPNNMFKFVLIPSCLAIFICAVMLSGNLGNINNIENDIKNPDDKVSLKINTIKDPAQTKLDADVNYCDIKDIDIKALQIPSDMKLESVSAIYVRQNKTSKIYNLLHDVSIQYNNGSYDKTIKIALSKKGAPLRDYYIKEKGLKESTINDISVIVTKLNDMYVATFNSNGIYYDIETTGLSEIELTELLKSVLKSDLGKIIEKEENTIREYKVLEEYDIGEPNYE